MKKLLIFIVFVLSAVTLWGQDFDSIVNRAKQCYFRNDFEGAEKEILYALDIDNKSPITHILYNQLSICQRNLGKTNDALKSCSEAIKIKNDNPSYYTNRSFIETDLADYKSSIKDCDKALELNNKYIQAYNSRSTAKAELKDFDGAILDLKIATSIDSNNLTTKFNTVFVLLKQGKNKESLELFNKYIAIYSDSSSKTQRAMLYNNRADIYIKQGKFELAIADIDKSIETDPLCDDCYVTKGEYFLNNGSYNLAYVCFNKAFDLGFKKQKIKDYIITCKKNMK